MHPEWLSNAYLAWDEETREGYFVDSGAPLEPLLEAVEREGLTIASLLTTHGHHDHVAGDAELERRFGVRPTQEADWARSIPTPGHADETTIGREREENPFLRYWLGAAPSIDETVGVAGDEATLLVWSPDYDGKGKALVRLGDGSERIVGGSRVER